MDEQLDIVIIDGVKYAIIPVPEKDLPVKLPRDVDFRPTGESPLARSRAFHKVKCPECGSPARRESDTMDTFVDSSWYYLRYCDPRPEAKSRRAPHFRESGRKEGCLALENFVDSLKIKYWCPVDLYVGGAEHAVMHLLYARFFAKVLYDLKYINFAEPFLRLRNQGLILGEDGQKMSKSRGNVINPDDVVKDYGADTLRMYEMFMGDFALSKPWSTSSIKGVRRFLDRVWLLQERVAASQPSRAKSRDLKRHPEHSEGSHADKDLERLLHKTIKKVTEDIEAFKFNTAISAMMILINGMWDFVEAKHRQNVDVSLQNKIPKEWYEQLVLLLSPVAPHICEEIWEKLGHKNSIIKELWPIYDSALIKDEEVNLVVQVNGKVRGIIRVPANISEEEAKSLALANEKVKKYLEGQKAQKVIFVPGKLLNFVV